MMMQCTSCNQHCKNLYATCQSCNKHFCNDQETPTSLSHILKHIKETNHNVFSVPQQGLLSCKECQRSNIIDLYQDPSGVCLCSQHKNDRCFKIVQNRIVNLRYTIFSQQGTLPLIKQAQSNTQAHCKQQCYREVTSTRPSMPKVAQNQQIQYKEITFENIGLAQTISNLVSQIECQDGRDFSNIRIIDADEMAAMQTRKFYTDGGYSPDNGQGGYAAIEVVNQKIVSNFYSGFNNTSSNRMEMIAILLVLESTRFDEHVCIGTDSLLTIQDIVQNIYHCRENKWMKTSKQNCNFDLVCRMLLALKGKSVSFSFVKAHGSNQFNNYVDKLTHMKRYGSDDIMHMEFNQKRQQKAKSVSPKGAYGKFDHLKEYFMRC